VSQIIKVYNLRNIFCILSFAFAAAAKTLLFFPILHQKESARVYPFHREIIYNVIDTLGKFLLVSFNAMNVYYYVHLYIYPIPENLKRNLPLAFQQQKIVILERSKHIPLCVTARSF